MSGDHIDLSSEHPDSRPSEQSAQRGRFLGIHFACCGVYARIYPNRNNTAYVGYCPRCSRRAEIKIGPGGADTRFFTAY